ncbi:MAG: hypothetical protein ACRDS0_09470 [Pseudonocardiaceae bacterium]
MSPAVLLTPLRVEQAALRRPGHSLRPVHTGMGPRRAARTAATLPPGPTLVAGLAAAQSPHIHPGDVVVATEIRVSALLSPSSTPELRTRRRAAMVSNSATTEPPGAVQIGAVQIGAVQIGAVQIPSGVLLAGALRGLGLRVHTGPICSVPRIAWRPVADGSLAVDMESAQLAVPGCPFAVVRVIVDTPEYPLWHVGTLHRGIAALRTLRACRPALEWWAAATGPREIQLLTTFAAEIARRVDLLLVVGSPRLAEVAQREGVPAYLVDDVSQIDLRWLAGRTRLGIVAGPPHLVQEIVHALSGLGPVTTSEPIDKAIAAAKEVI